MPTLLRVGPYQFFIVMFDCGEQMHDLVKGGGRGEARGYIARDLARIEAIAHEHRQTLRERWVEVCEGGR
jgi:hypothetical protein